MNTIQELKRLNSPAPKPQSLAWDGPTLWVGSRETKHVYSIDPVKWTVTSDTPAPGTPWGMTVTGSELRVLCGETADDNRIIRRFIPGKGFDSSFAWPCPDDTGSQLSFDGHRLHVSQWYNRRVLALGSTGQVEATISAPHQICGQVFVKGTLYLLTTENEATTDYWLTRVDLSSGTPKAQDVAHIPFAGRALAWDGQNFWTNHREQNQIVSFTVAGVQP